MSPVSLYFPSVVLAYKPTIVLGLKSETIFELFLWDVGYLETDVDSIVTVIWNSYLVYYLCFTELGNWSNLQHYFSVLLIKGLVGEWYESKNLFRPIFAVELIIKEGHTA